MGEQDKYKEPSSNITILGINLLVFAIYTGMGLINSSGDAIVISFGAAIIHFVMCCITAITQRKWAWFLAGVLIIVIGFGTCVSNFKMGHM